MNLEINITAKKDGGYHHKPLAQTKIEVDSASFNDQDIRALAGIAAGNIISALRPAEPFLAALLPEDTNDAQPAIVPEDALDVNF